MFHKDQKVCIISLGGSLVVPDQIDWEYLHNFKAMIERYAQEKWKFVIVVGGGRTARRYIEAGERVESAITNEDKDWLGIHATRLNAHFVRTIFRDIAHPRINTNPHHLEDFYNFKESVLVAAGWRPGNSTDYIAVVLAQYLGIARIANFSNIDYVYDKDPKHFEDAQKIENITWSDFRSIVGDEWSPGKNVPFDPIASQLAQENGLEVAMINGKELDRFEKYLVGETFQGTVISGK